MKGAFLGDIIGSRFEFKGNKTEDFELFTKKNYFTDDTVLTVATMDSILHNIPFDESYKKWGNKYPNCGYGWMFRPDEMIDIMREFYKKFKIKY